MKKINFFLILFFLHLPLQVWALDISCFSETSLVSSQKDYIVLESSAPNIWALSEGQELPLESLEKEYRYIALSSPTHTLKSLSGSFEKRYFLENMDTQESKEIVVKIAPTEVLWGYDFIFKHDSKSYTPEFYISENGTDFSKVSEQDIDDFSPQAIKVIFKAKESPELREMIHISEISLRKKNYSFLVKNPLWKNISLYKQNNCGNIQRLSDGTLSWKAVETLFPTFYENYSYTLKILDSDEDGIMDAVDNCKTLRNSTQRDINQNKIGDACEFDSDGDTIYDEIDNCRNTKNTDQSDSDSDMIGNACDNCAQYNPNQLDSDNNKIGDVCEQAKKFLAENDTDSDGIDNTRDNCKEIPNPLQEDSDSDRVGDACDICKSYQNPFQEDSNTNGVWDICEDSDGDGKDGLTDNCRDIANPLQEDSDNDGVGNICEDDDSDGILFQNDNCPYISNINQWDIDSDGLGDVCDDKDDRFIESNKIFFISLFVLLWVIFLSGIYFLLRKIQK